MALYEIIYVSLAAQDIPPQELAALLEKSRNHNQSKDITGAMVYRKREFLQLLEGEKSAVLALYDRIERDPRHQQISKLWDGPIAQRSFSSWDMAFMAPDDLALKGRPGYRDLLDHGFRAHPGDTTGKKLLMALRDDFLVGD